MRITKVSELQSEAGTKPVWLMLGTWPYPKSSQPGTTQPRPRATTRLGLFIQLSSFCKNFSPNC
jgi:hypothetical protein